MCIRDRFDVSRDSEPQSKLAAGTMPGPIPGQRIGWDSDKNCGFLEESLHDDEHQVVREQLQQKGFSFAKAREEFDGDGNTWAFWMYRAVQNDIAKLVSGKFPKIDESKVKKNFLTVEVPGPTDRLAEALNRQSAAMEGLLTRLA